MTPPPADGPAPENPVPWEDLLRQLLGPDADDLVRRLAEGDLSGLPSLGTGPDGTPLDLSALAAAAGLPDDPADLAQVLHGEQRFAYRAPVMVGDTLRFEPRIAGITDKKGGAMTLAVVETRVTNQHGVHVADCTRTVVVLNKATTA